MLRSESPVERASLGFLEAATSEFMFLVEEFAFSCVKRDVTFVRYESKNVFVNIYHGRSSFELNVEIGERSLSENTRERSFAIGDILYVTKPEVAERYYPYQVTTPE